MSFRPPDSIEPVQVDPNIRFTSIGGLKEHIKCIREIIIFPLMYPELFKKFNTRPAKGVLFHGPPGTGKTLLARALANECSLISGKRVSFFMRQGADVMNKYYGESERILRSLFQTARRMKPSIIFFDEIDALAPARKQSHDTHSSLVATLLAEMDGLCDRGNVVVIGATNRPDAMDPAVRRAGRFDRELYFPPPEIDARREILHIYTKDWDPALSDEVLNHIAKITVGFLGSDVKSLCSEAVLKAVRRVYPQIYETDYKLLVNAQNVEVTLEDLLSATEQIVPTGARYAPPAARRLPVHTQPLLQDQVQDAAFVLNKAFPPPRGGKGNASSESSSAPSVFLVCGDCAGTLIVPALLAQLDYCFIKELSVPALHASHVNSPEHAVISLFSECRLTGRPCIIFIRDLLAVWNALDKKHSAEVLVQMWQQGAVGENTLLMAAWGGEYEQLPKILQEIFPVYKDCMYRVRKPTPIEVMNFLRPIVTELPLVPPRETKLEPLPPLPRAPCGPRENEEDKIRRMFQEYDNLRVLRSKLRKICRTLSSDRRYIKFNSPIEESAEYCALIKQAMDLSKMMIKVERKQYYCAKEFLDDIDLICANAILYNRVKPEKRLNLDAIQLHSDAYSMVTEEVHAQLELECQLIARKRREGDDESYDPQNYDPDFYYSHPGSNKITDNIFDCSNSRKRPRKDIKGPEAKRSRGTNKSNPTSPPNSKNKKAVRIGPTDIINISNPDNNDSEAAEEPTSPLQVLIDKAELENITITRSEPLCEVGLEALIDLHTQLSKTVYGYSDALDRTKLPQDLKTIIDRYIEHKCRTH